MDIAISAASGSAITAKGLTATPNRSSLKTVCAKAEAHVRTRVEYVRRQRMMGGPMDYRHRAPAEQCILPPAVAMGGSVRVVTTSSGPAAQATQAGLLGRELELAFERQDAPAFRRALDALLETASGASHTP
jgi:hypothetical protein